MNKSLEEALSFLDALEPSSWPASTRVCIAAPHPFLHAMSLRIKQAGLPVELAAQDAHYEDSGAFTGDVSALALKSVGVDSVILGHSERRQYHFEDDALIAKKIRAVLDNGLKVIYCCGERLPERHSGKEEDVVRDQLTEALAGLTEQDWRRITIAYEPVWAIGTGEVATPEQAESMHAFIRGLLPEAADKVSILYGGSMKPSNAQELLAKDHVDGGLIGGASLKADSFQELIHMTK
jgi:triosephosphate isomerase